MNSNSIITDSKFRLIIKSEKIIVGNIYEFVYFFDVEKNELIAEFKHSDDPEGAIVGNGWAMSYTNEICVLKEEELHIIDCIDEIVVDARIKNEREVELLTDPWSENSAIWTLDLLTYVVTMDKSFSDYHLKPYTEEIKW